MSTPGSITRQLEDLRSQDVQRRDFAAAEIWNRYFPELLRYAASHLSPQLRQRADPEDVLQSVYKSFCARMVEGTFPGLGSRDELIRTLVTIARRKISSLAKFHQRDKRDMRREQVKPAYSSDIEGNEWDFYAELGQSGPTPEEAVSFADTLEQYLTRLPEELRQFVLLKVEGYTDEEIADKLRCSIRTVERKKRLIREYWQKD